MRAVSQLKSSRDREKGERKRGGKDKPDGETEMGVFRSGRAHRRVGS